MSFSPLDSALLGPLFATDAMRAAFDDAAMLAGMLRAEAALARAQAELGEAPAGLAAALETLTPDMLDAEALGREIAVAGIPVIPFVKAVRKLLPAELEPFFHAGTTTQDIVDTGLVLQLREALDLVRADLAAILAGLSRLAAEHARTPCAGRTFDQHAAPVTFGYKAAVWALGIAEVAADLPQVERRVLAASLGGPVGTLGSFGAHGSEIAVRYARILGLSAEPLAWHTRRARIAGLGAWLGLLLGALGKMAADIVHLAATEISEVAEPHVPGRGGSSAMPHKRNPIAATVILANQGASVGPVGTLMASMVAAHERPAGAWHAEWHALPQLFGLASGALREGRLLAEGLVVDADRMRENLEATRGLLFADAAAAALAPVLGSRGAAHHLVERAAGEVRTSRRPLREVLAGMPEAAGAKDLDAAFDLEPAVAAAAAATGRALAEIARLSVHLT